MSCPICGAVLPFGGLQRRCDRCDMEMMLHAQLAETAEKRIAELERERDEALAKVAELEVHRAPNPGMVGTIRDKNSLLECKDQLIAQLRARIAELEAHTKVAESDFVSSLLRIHGLLVDDRDNLRAVLRHTIQGVDSPSK